MSGRKHFLRETLRNPGIFYKILGTLVILAGIITILLAVFLSRLLYQGKTAQIDQVSILRLEQAAETLETALSSVEEGLDMLHWNSEFINFSVNPNATDISRDQSILQTMSSMNIKNLVGGLWFVSYYSDQVFVSDGEKLSIEEKDSIKDIWEAYQEADLSDGEESGFNTRNAVFLDRDGNLYVCSELALGNPVSVLVCRMDMEAVSQMLPISSDEPDSYICIFDRKGTALLEDYYTYWCSGGELSNSSLFLTSGKEAERGNIYYLYISENNQWSYVSQRDSSFSAVSAGELAAVLLPILVAVVLLSLLFSWYIARTVYRPIGKLVELFMGREEAPPAPEMQADAFAYMEDAYMRMAGENDRARGMAREFSLKILKDTMKKIIDGRLLEDEYLEETFSAIGNPVGIRDRYMVLLGHLEPPEASPSQNMEQNMYIISIYEILAAWKAENILVVPIYTYFDTFAVVLTAPSQVSALTLQQEAVSIREKISQVGRSFPYRFFWGRGRVYEHVSDLKYSYLDARQDLQYQMYHEGEPEASESDEMAVYMKKRIAQIPAEISGVNREESETLVRRMMEEIREKSASEAQAKELYEQLCSGVLEKMLSLHIPEEEIRTIYERPISAILSEAEDMPQEAEKLCQQSLWLIEIYSRKSKYLYVEAAEDYIRQHYKDSDLSQNEVAEHVGITPSYLSERFREVTGEPFSSYLNNYRVEQAKLLLTAGSVAVGEVGFLCGFSSPQNFSRVFRKFTGMTPRQFRNQKQNG